MEKPTVLERRLRADATTTEELDAALAPRSTPPAAPDSVPNAIHTAAGARDYGYQGALVAGVLLFAWSVPAVLDALGDVWLSSGWAQVSFRRPVYAGAALTVRVTHAPEEAGAGDGAHGVVPPSVSLSVTVDQVGPCVEGRAGLGPAPWSAELSQLPPRRPDPPLPDDRRPLLTLESAAPGSDLRTLDATVGVDAARAFGLAQPEPRPPFCGESPLVHPAVLARQMISLLGHSYDYGRPSIHVATHLENLAPVPAGQPLALSGRLVRTYERRGHDYCVVDGCLYRSEGVHPLARLRHTNIFRVARRSQG